MSDSEADPGFAVLPARLRRRIDHTFDAVAKKSSGDVDDGPARKRRKLDVSERSGSVPVEARGFIIEDNSAPGGFVVDDTSPGGFMVDDSAAGGFIPESTSTTDEDDPTSSNRIDHIPFAVIPSALQILDLQPDDDDVLSVFRNAATGWENKHAPRTNEHGDSHLLVSRKDWRAVCAALMDVTTGDDDGEDRDGDEDVEMRDDDDGDMVGNDSGEEYVESGDDSDFGEEEDDSDDEYAEGGFVHSKSQRQTSDSPRKSMKRRGVTSTSLSPMNSSDEDEFEKAPRRITARQKAESRRAFTLFFPEVPDEDLDKQKIMIKDIARVSTLLKEKLTAEEIVEMLKAFSTSPDQSMSLGDFERMMVTAKLA